MNNYIIWAISITLGLIIAYVLNKYFYKSVVFNDILKEKTPDGLKYSQGRVYLFWAIISYYITLGVMTSKGLNPEMDIDTKTLEMIIEALQWTIALMAGYVFGSKGLEVLKTLVDFKKTKNNSNNPPEV